MALCRNVLQQDDVLCELYADTRSDVSVYSDKVWTVTVTSPQLVHVNNCDLLLVYWPHNFHTHFSSHLTKDNFYNSVRLAQTLLDRNMRVCSIMRSNRGIPCHLEGEGRRLKMEVSAFWKNGDIMVQVWKDKTCANDKYNPWCNNCKPREEREENKHGNKEA